MKYYEITGETRKRLEEMERKRKEGLKEAQRLTTEIGATHFRLGSVFADDAVAAFDFDDEAKINPKQLQKFYDRRERKHQPYFVPKKTTKEGKELRARMDRIKLYGRGEVARLVCIKGFIETPQGISLAGPGLDNVGKRLILICKDYYPEPNSDCKRICELEYEKLTKKPKRKK